MKPGNQNSFNSLKEININGKNYSIYSLKEAEKNGLEGINKLPKSIKVLLENLLRYEDNITVNKQQILSNRTRPTIMLPLWKVGVTSLGFVSSLLGEKYVNACTEAIESTIVDHYQEQVKYLKKINERSDLRKNIMKFCDEENQHKLSSQKKSDNEKGTFLFKQITKNITKLAIKISKKL